MDITSNNDKTKIRDKYSNIGLTAILLVTTISISTVIYFGSEAIPSLSLILFSVAIENANAWNKELKSDGYAPVNQVQSTYMIAFIFIPLSVLPSLIQFYGLVVPLVFTVILSFASYRLLKYILFRGVSNYDKQVNTYEGPPVVYIVGGSYKEHVEEIAKKRRT